MYHFLRRYLSDFQFWRYILTLPLYYINSMLPALSLYLGAWIVEHSILFYGLLGLICLMAFLHLIFGKAAIYHQKILYTSIHQAGMRLRMDLMKAMIKNREIPVDHSVQLNEVEKIEEDLFLGGIELIEQVLFYLLAFGVIFFLNPWIALSLSALSLLVSVINTKSRKKGKFYQSQNSDQQKKQLEFLEQTEAGYETILMYQQQKRMEEQFHAHAFALCTAQGQLRWNQEKTQIVTMTFLLTGGTFITLTGSTFINAGTLTLAQLLVILQFSNHLFKPIQRIMTAWFQVQSVQGTVEKVDKILEGIYLEDSFDKKGLILQLHQALELNLKEFSIGQKKILQSMAFTIQKGEKVLLLGPNGCGKTTLLRYLLGYYGYQKESVWIDGRDCSQLPWEFVSTVFAPVDQNFFLLSGTVKENISCFRKLSDQTEKEVVSLCRLEEILDREEATKLSGGQIQRIAIARAAAVHHSILVLDEAFRAIDTENNSQIEQSLLQDSELTVIEIAHRMTIENYLLFNKVILMDRGQIEKIGTPQQLLTDPFIENLLGKE